MPISQLKTIGASASSNANATGWIPLNQFSTPFNVGFVIYVSGVGQPTVRVEHTMHDVMRSTAGVDALVHEDVSGVALTSGTNTLDGNYAYPVNAVRLAVVSASGNSVVHFRVNQAGL